MMLSKGKTLLSMSQVVRDLSGALLTSSRCYIHSDSYPKMPARKDLKRLVPPDKSKVYDACWQSMRRTEYKCRSDPEFNVPAFIESRKSCLAGPCADDVLALDLTHYRPSDMRKRRYPRTWYECVVKRRKRKAHCIHKAPNPPRRKRKTRKLSPCAQKGCVLGGLDLKLRKPCKPIRPTKCPRFKMPNCCKEPRNPPKCVRPFRAGLCHRRKTKYPSFSECRHDPIPDVRPIECNCLSKPSICEMWEYYRRRKC